MAEIPRASRVPESIVPVRHRMPFRDRLKDNAGRLHRIIKGEQGGAHRMPRSERPGIRANLGMAALSTLLTVGVFGVAKHTEAEMKPAVISQEQQQTLTTHRYDACQVMDIQTGAQTADGHKMRVDWLLRHNEAANTMLQQYSDSKDIVVGPTEPVVRTFKVDAHGQAAVGGRVGAETIDTENKRYNPDHFYATLPEPKEGERYALAVGNSLFLTRADGTSVRVYGEQQCAELVWRGGSESTAPHWEYREPNQALAAQDIYAVTNLPADRQ